MQRIQRGVNILDLVIKFLNLNSTGTLLSYARMTELQRKCKPEASLIQCSGSGWIRVFFANTDPNFKNKNLDPYVFCF